MLYEIYCEQFHNKRVIFNDNLNVVLGTDSAHNSIGKSTFLLIVDFVFGGDRYSKSDDIIRNIDSHDIFFTFKFNDTFYKFCRNNTKSSDVWQCNENYDKIEKQSINDFRKWLDKMYNIQLPDLSFRDAVGRYIRVYGKDNCDEKRPLHYLSNEKMENAILALLKLFDVYSPIKDAQIDAEHISKEYTTFTNAQKFDFITNITKKQYDQNTKQIELIKEELNNFSTQIEWQIIGIDLSVSEEVLDYKNLLSKTRRLLGNVKTKYNIINSNQEYKFPLTTNTYNELGKYFPNIALKSIEKVENFHNQIAKIFKDELKEEKNKLQQLIQEYNQKINNYENNIRRLLNNTDVPNKILQRHATLIKNLDELQKQNATYERNCELKENKKTSKDTLIILRNRILGEVENKINTKMKELNDYIYGGSHKSPVLHFVNSGYDFYTPDDTGTGMAYKGLIIFDLAVLLSTKLPLIVHDSLILKQIYDNAVEKILELYIKANKQIIIAFDKQNSYTKISQQILREKTILKLAPDGEELFGKSWG